MSTATVMRRAAASRPSRTCSAPTRARCSTTAARASRRRRSTCPGPTSWTACYAASDRPVPVLRSLQQLLDHGRLAGTGYVSILPVDQGIEHSAGASLRQEPGLLRPREHREARHRGRLQRGRLDARRAGRGGAQVRAQDPVHREDQPQRVPHLPEQVRPDPVRHASSRRADMGAVAVGATIYFGSDRVGAADRRGRRRPSSTRTSWAWPPCSGATCATPPSRRGQGLPRLRRPHRPGQPPGRHASRPTSSSRSCRRTTAATRRSAPRRTRTARSTSASTRELTSDHPIDLCRYQVANCYMGRAGLINSGGASGENDFAEAVKTAVINKRAGGMGLISGRKAFQRPMAEGVEAPERRSRTSTSARRSRSRSRRAARGVWGAWRLPEQGKPATAWPFVFLPEIRLKSHETAIRHRRLGAPMPPPDPLHTYLRVARRSRRRSSRRRPSRRSPRASPRPTCPRSAACRRGSGR